jgi:hypothetical protein
MTHHAGVLAETDREHDLDVTFYIQKVEDPALEVDSIPPLVCTPSILDQIKGHVCSSLDSAFTSHGGTHQTSYKGTTKLLPKSN